LFNFGQLLISCSIESQLSEISEIQQPRAVEKFIELLKISPEFSTIQQLNSLGNTLNMSKNTEAKICFILFSHQFSDRSYVSYMIL